MGKLICELMPVSSYLSIIVSFIAYGFIEYEDKRDAEVSLTPFYKPVFCAQGTCIDYCCHLQCYLQQPIASRFTPYPGTSLISITGDPL